MKIQFNVNEVRKAVQTLQTNPENNFQAFKDRFEKDVNGYTNMASTFASAMADGLDISELLPPDAQALVIYLLRTYTENVDRVLNKGRRVMVMPGISLN